MASPTAPPSPVGLPAGSLARCRCLCGDFSKLSPLLRKRLVRHHFLRQVNVLIPQFSSGFNDSNQKLDEQLFSRLGEQRFPGTSEVYPVVSFVLRNVQLSSVCSRESVEQCLLPHHISLLGMSRGSDQEGSTVAVVVEGKEGRSPIEKQKTMSTKKANLVIACDSLLHQSLGIESFIHLPQFLHAGARPRDRRKYVCLDISSPAYLRRKVRAGTSVARTTSLGHHLPSAAEQVTVETGGEATAVDWGSKSAGSSSNLYNRVQWCLSPERTAAIDMVGSWNACGSPIHSIYKFAEETRSLLRRNGSPLADVIVAPSVCSVFRYTGGVTGPSGNFSLQSLDLDYLLSTVIMAPPASLSVPPPLEQQSAEPGCVRGDVIEDLVEYIGFVCMGLPIPKNRFRCSTEVVPNVETLALLNIPSISSIAVYSLRTTTQPLTSSCHTGQTGALSGGNIETKQRSGADSRLPGGVRGLVSSAHAVDLMDYFVELIKRSALNGDGPMWFVIAMRGEIHSPVAYGMNPHGFDTNGSNEGYLICFVRDRNAADVACLLVETTCYLDATT
eukprot:GHVS01020361.1.p1 GENE.GHVS01020361.1~~GHVS01020361.1.p1  ORF type:complete len:557 (-),score=57.16 GHVS01020361.1:76-1746(-)